MKASRVIEFTATDPEVIGRPDRSECAEYYWGYLDRVPEDGDLFTLLARGREEVLGLLGDWPPARETAAYAPGKWTIREVVGHLVDTDQVFGHRALWFARGGGELPGMDQDAFVAHSKAKDLPLAHLLEAYRRQRDAHIELFRGFDETAWKRTGTASGYELTVRALAFLIVGHEQHHLHVLRERYLGLREGDPRESD